MLNIMKKLFCTVLCFIVLSTSVYAKPIEGEDVEEKAFAAILDILDFFEILLHNYTGSNITVEQLYEAALRGISEELDDYSQLLTEADFNMFTDDLAGSYEGVGIMITGGEGGFVFIRDVFEGSGAEKAGLKPGDIITKVNKKSVTGESASFTSEAISNAPKTFEMEVLRAGKTLKFTVTKGSVTAKTASVLELKDIYPAVTSTQNDKIGYLFITTFGDNTAKEFETALNSLKNSGKEYLILDLRGNTGGRVDIMEEMAQLIVPKGVLYSVRYAGGDNETVYSHLGASPFKHIAILTDSYTASASEVIASALQDAKVATVIGQKTNGKGTAQVAIPTLTGGVFLVTIAHNHRRSGGIIHGKGVTPDIAVAAPEFIEYYAATDKDAADLAPAIKKALEYIGYKPGKTSGYDKLTKSELTRFQKDMALSETGMPDEETVFYLNVAMLNKYLEKDYELERAVSFFETTHKVK